MIRSDSIVKFDSAVIDSLSNSRGLSDNPLSTFKEIMTALSQKESSRFNPAEVVALVDAAAASQRSAGGELIWAFIYRSGPSSRKHRGWRGFKLLNAGLSGCC